MAILNCSFRIKPKLKNSKNGCFVNIKELYYLNTYNCFMFYDTTYIVYLWLSNSSKVTNLMVTISWTDDKGFLSNIIPTETIYNPLNFIL